MNTTDPKKKPIEHSSVCMTVCMTTRVFSDDPNCPACCVDRADGSKDASLGDAQSLRLTEEEAWQAYCEIYDTGEGPQGKAQRHAFTFAWTNARETR